jgi:hypothetical protein
MERTILSNRIPSPECNTSKLAKIDQFEQKSRYINTILSKFERRTTTKVMKGIKARDEVIESRSVEP